MEPEILDSRPGTGTIKRLLDVPYGFPFKGEYKLASKTSWHDGTGTLRRAYVEPALSDQDKEVLGDLLELLAEMEQREKPKRYTKRSFARDFAKYDKWPKYGSRKLEALVSYALDQGLLFIEECRNAQNSPVDYLTLRKSENSAR